MPTGPDSFPTAMPSRARGDPPAVTAQRERPERQLGPERGRLGVDAVGPADDRGVTERVGPGGDDRVERVHRLEEQVAGPDERDGQRVSTTSLEVRPWWIHRAAGPPTRAWTTSTNAAVS